MNDAIAGPKQPGAMVFVLLTVSISWSIWIAAWLATGRPATLDGPVAMMAAIYAGSFGPGVAAAILSATAHRGAFKEWLRGFIRLRCGWRAYAAALLPFPLAILLVTIALGYRPRIEGLNGLDPILLYVTIFPVSIFNGAATAILGAGPFGEEGGWRGYLLPRLLEQGGEVRASLIIGIVWALWHLPIMAMFADWRSGIPFAAYLPLYTLGVIGLSFVLSRVWIIGQGSLVPCIWLHGLVNAVGGMAFERSLWTSRWSPEASAGHFAIAAALAAAFLFWMKRRSRRP